MPAHLGMAPSLLGGRPALAYVPGGGSSRIRLGAVGPARRPHPPAAGSFDDFGDLPADFPADSSGDFSGDEGPKRRARRAPKEPRARRAPRRSAAASDAEAEDPEAAAAAAARAASAMFDNMDDAAKQDLWVRLCENDVEYNEMKNMCKANDLGGKDMKYKLRAKLIKQVGEQLGKRRWTRDSYGAGFKAPSKMGAAELAAFFDERDIVMPEDRDEAVGFAYAIMVQDGAIDAAAVPSPSDYDHKNVEELKAICKGRGLPQTGNKAEMMSRLIAHDQEVARQKRQVVARAAAVLERRDAAVDAPPRPPNAELAAKLDRAVATAAEIGGMSLPQLRACAYGRGLPVYGTVEALQDRIMEVLRREAVEAHAGRDRLLRYAEAAVGKLGEEEVLQGLALRGVARKSLGGAEEEAVRLINTLVDEWIHNALHPLPGEDDGEEEGGQDGAAGGVDADDGEEGYEPAEAQGGAGEEDPTLDVVLLCTGATAAAREAGLAAARALVPLLQTDVLWGTINPAVEQEVPYIDEEARAAAAAGQLAPPADAVEIFTLAPLAHGVMMHLNCPLVAPDTLLVVTAVPMDDPALPTVVKECRPADAIVLQGLAPDAMYEFSVRLRNAAGDGPVAEGGTFETATPPRHGVAAWVALELPPPSDDGVFGGGEAGEARYVMLTWEELHGCALAEIDAKLRAGGGGAAGARPLRALLPAGAVVLPLGPPSPADGASDAPDAAFVGSWGSPEARRLAASRPAFAAAAADLGYEAVSLLELPAAELAGDLSAAEAKLQAWLEGQGADPAAARVAVRLEAPGGDVVGVGVGRGPAEILGGAAELVAAHGAPAAVLEVIHPGAVFFSVTVVEGPGGAAVALPPTEIGYEDLEEDFFASELELQKFQAVTAGDDPTRVAALVEYEKEGRRLPPGAVGSLVLPTQRAAHATPPASLPPGVAESVRSAAAKLFGDLGLRDFARFSGWVVPEDPLGAAGLGPAAELLRAAAAGAPADSEPEPRAAPKPFSALQALHEQEQARLADEARAAASPHSLKDTAAVSQRDRDAAVDVQDYAYAVDEEEPEAALANLPVMREAGEGAEAPVARFGTFAGIALDDRTRADLLEATPPPPARPVPEGLPEVTMPTALPDLAAAAPGALCRVGGRRIAFSALSVSLGEVGDRLGPLAAAAAAAGTSVPALARQLVSAAAARAGLPPLASRPLTPPPDFFDDAEEDAAVPEDLDLGPEGTEEVPPTLDQIGADLENWEWEREQPLEEGLGGGGGVGGEEEDFDPTQESYDAIRLAAEAAAAAAAAEAALGADGGGAAALAGLPGGADAFGLGVDAPGVDPDAAEAPGMDLRRDFPGLHPTRQRVWVLCGGEGPQRDVSLAAAAHAAAVLQGEQDLLVETFFLDPYDAGAGERDRRGELLARRLALQKMGAGDDDILEHAPEYHPSRIRAPAPPPADALDWRGVWRLGSTPLVRPNVPDLAEGCEQALAAGTTVYLERSEGDEVHRRETLLAAAREELRLAGLEPGGPAPWGGYLGRGELPQYSFLKDWVAAAQERCVVVLLALPGHPAAAGPLQRLLESRAVPFTGAASVGVELCADRPELLRLLGPEPPYHTLALPELSAQCETEAAANDFHARLFGGWEGKILSIRPAHACGGLGAARVACGRDLQVYCAAVRQWAPAIPAGLLAGEDGDVAMPVPPPTQFVIEPASHGVWLTLPEEEEAAAGAGAAAPAAADPLAARLAWPPKDPKDRWLEVKACLLGAAGSMRALSLTATVVCTRRDPATGADAVVDSFELTPIPPSILAPDKALEARLRLQQVADTTALSGAATITALVDTCSGEVCEVIVREVDPHPDLSPEGLLMRQAAAAPIPLSPVHVFRELLKVGMSREGGGAGDNGDLGWLGGEGLYDLSAGMGAGDGLGPRGGVGDGGGGGGQYWGHADVEIDPDLLDLSEEEIEREVKRQAKKERERREGDERRRAAAAMAALDDDPLLG